ncbi:MAG TPA: hypothetical protein VGI20_10975 [Rhizomicrobium sp.]|jgi:hypothetical protein
MSEPAIAIAGREWEIPILAPRQNRIVLPGLLRPRREPGAQYESLLDIVFAALTRAHPWITREEFEDWPIASFELVDAIPVIAKQTGFLTRFLDRLGMRRPHAEPVEAPDWDALIAETVNFLPGTTPDYWEDALTAPRLFALKEEWRQHPPLAVIAAAVLGYRKPPRHADAIDELLRLFPGGKLRVN